MDHQLSCNYLKCRQRLTGFAWVTSCSHIFCDDDGKREFSKAYKCPACSSQLTNNCDIVRVDLSPSEQYKSMILTGLKPDVVIEVAQRAISFWNYQMFQERAYQEHSCNKYKQKIFEAQQYMQDMKNKYTAELQGLKLQLGETKKKVADMEGTLHQKEGQVNDLSRRFRNQQYMFNELKMKSNELSSTSFAHMDKHNERLNGGHLNALNTTVQSLPNTMPGTPMQLLSNTQGLQHNPRSGGDGRNRCFAFGSNVTSSRNKQSAGKTSRFLSSAGSALNKSSSHDRLPSCQAPGLISPSLRRPLTPIQNLPPRPKTPSLGRALAARRQQNGSSFMS